MQPLYTQKLNKNHTNNKEFSHFIRSLSHLLSCTLPRFLHVYYYSVSSLSLHLCVYTIQYTIPYYTN